MRTLRDWEYTTAYPTVSIIVLNYRRVKDTIECIRSLAALNYKGNIELIVVENGSQDGSGLALSEVMANLPRPLRLIENAENLGFAGGVVSAMSQVTGQLVCLINNDAVVHPNYLTTLVDYFRKRADVGAVWPFDAPREWSADLRQLSEAEIEALRNGTHNVLGYNIWFPILRTPHECFTASGVCLLFDPTILNPPFPPEYFAYYEDVFFGWRLRTLGLACERVPGATIYHAGSQTTTSNPKLLPLIAFHIEKNRLCNLLIFYEWRSLIRLVPLLLIDLMKKIVSTAQRLIRRQQPFQFVFIHFKALWWIARNRRWLSELRGQVQKERTVPDNALFCLMSGRMTMDRTPLAYMVNWLTLSYCEMVGLKTCDVSDLGNGASRRRSRAE